MTKQYLSYVMLLSLPLSSYSEGIFESSIQNLDPSIETMKWCGKWTHNNTSGRYRIISGYIYGHTELYVQWIENPDLNNSENRTPKLRSTIGINTDLHSETYLDKIHCIKKGSHWKITANSENGYDDKLKKKILEVLLLDEPGKLEIKTY